MEIEWAGKREAIDGEEVIVFDTPFVFEVDDIFEDSKEV